jgi:hypothetical protein
MIRFRNLLTKFMSVSHLRVIYLGIKQKQTRQAKYVYRNIEAVRATAVAVEKQ